MNFQLKRAKLFYLLPLPLGMILPLQYKLWSSTTSDIPAGMFAGLILPAIFMVLCFAEFSDRKIKYRKDHKAFAEAITVACFSCAASQIAVAVASMSFGVANEFESSVRTMAVIILTVSGFIYAISGTKVRELRDIMMCVGIAMVSSLIIMAWMLLFSTTPISTSGALMTASIGGIPGYFLSYFIQKES